ncbi:hypothetical protein D3C78_1869810 [compost metagenome]
MQALEVEQTAQWRQLPDRIMRQVQHPQSGQCTEPGQACIVDHDLIARQAQLAELGQCLQAIWNAA